LLNRAARYFVILEQLPPAGANEPRILEIGSGSEGLGEFYQRPFVGCDVSFSREPRHPMRAVMCSGTALPFADGSFDAVVASDVMEHLAPEQRGEVIAEALRVARHRVIFGFPCGTRASELDHRLFAHYKARNVAPPIWLEEHLQNPFPDSQLFQDLPPGWHIATKPNEGLSFHYWLMRREMHRAWNYLFRLALFLIPGTVRRILRMFDEEPAYRKIFILTRQQPT